MARRGGQGEDDSLPLWRQRAELLRLLTGAPARWQVALWASVLTTAVVPAAFAAAVGVLVSHVPPAVDEGLGSPAARALWLALAVVAALLVVERVSAPVLETVRYRVAREIDGASRSRLLAAVGRQPRLAPLEADGVQSQLGLVEGGLFGTAGAAAVASAALVGRYVQTVTALAIVAWFSVPLALLVGAVIVAIRRRWHAAFSALADGLLTSADRLRRVAYTAELATTPEAAKEVRVFGLVDWLVARCRGYWTEAVAVPVAVRSRLRRSANVELTLLGLCYVLTFVLAARAAARGDIDLGLLTAILQAQFSAAQLIAPTVEDFSAGPGLAALRAARDVERRLEPTPTAPRRPRAASDRACELVLDGVSFTYPGASEPVLRHLDVQIPAGRSTALVGLNGAGKTTVVKLLCGLYEPTAGRILVDGAPLGDLDPAAWRERVAVIFQDFVRYQLPARDNVGFGALRLAGDAAALSHAARAAGAAAVVDELPLGWDTVLSRQYPGGAELSGGQWQRIALARALLAVRAGAGLLVLDEPTASLDVRAEAELFDRFLHWTGGATALLISHRFSTVRRADQIAVLADGRIVETGTHDQLLALGGRYAALFRAQARRFGTRPAEPEATDA